MSPFTNNQVFLSSLPDWQDVNFESISPRYRKVVFIQYLIFISVFLLILLGVFWINEHSWNFTYSLTLCGGICLFVLLILLSFWSIRYWGFAMREHDLLYRSGVFSKSVKIIPYKQVQHVDINEGMISRLFGLSSIELHTAGAGEGIKIVGIDSSKVNYIQEYISKKISNDSTY